MTILLFSSTALEMAMVMPRSLKEPVGLSPSNFRKILSPLPSFSEIRRANKSGVSPSFKVMTGVDSVTGK